MAEKLKNSYLPPYDLLYEGLNLKEIIGDRGIKLLIPRSNLFGRQAPQEYDNTKRRQIEFALGSEGIDFLLHNPIIVCAVPLNNQLLLAIMDGHHRNRYAGLYQISVMPSLICTPEIMVDVINSNKSEEHKITQEAFIRQLLMDTSNVLSFLPEDKQPKTLVGISGINELSAKFESF